MRLSRHEYFMQIAVLTAERATCPRAHVGAIAVKNRHIIMSAYNGSPPHAKHCDDVGCYMVNGHCIRTVHAETNLISNCAKMGISLEGATVYVTHKPCAFCTKLLISAGVEYVIYKENMKDKDLLPEYQQLINIAPIKEVEENERGIVFKKAGNGLSKSKR